MTARTERRQRRAQIFAFVVSLSAAVAGCSARRTQPPLLASDGTQLQVMLDIPDELPACRYTTVEYPLTFGQPGPYGLPHRISVDIGDQAVTDMTQALDEGFSTATDSADSADLIAWPRIVAVQSARPPSVTSVVAEITYGVDFRAPTGEQIAEVTASGRGAFEYPVLVTLARLVFHLGTLTLFDGLDRDHQHSKALRAAQQEAAAKLATALRQSTELHAYAATLRAGRRPTTRDARIEQLIDTVIGNRSLAIAVLDLEPLDGSPTVVESYLGEELRTRLARRSGVRTFERAFLAKALEEMQLNMTDLVDPEHARRFGRLLSADAILTGTTVHFPGEAKLTLRMLDTESGRVVGAGSTMFSTYGEFPRPAGNNIAAHASACPPMTVPPPPPTPRAAGYRVWQPSRGWSTW